MRDEEVLGRVNATRHGKYAPETLLVAAVRPNGGLHLLYLPQTWNLFYSAQGQLCRVEPRPYETVELTDQEVDAAVVGLGNGPRMTPLQVLEACGLLK